MDALSEGLNAALAGAPGRVFVAFSGGLDSTVLLHALLERRRDGVTAVHVNHGLHPLAHGWQRHCVDVCERWLVPMLARSVTIPRRGNLEAEARAARYRLFAALLERPDDRLFLAHHLGDQVETALLRLMQGRGLYGMPRGRSLGAGRLMRPFLDVPRADLAAYAIGRGLHWVEDPANVDLSFDRNFLRHSLLPVVRERWPGVDRAIVAALPPPAAEVAASRLAVSDLLARPDAQGVALLRGWLGAHGVASPPRAALEEFLCQLGAGRDRQPCLRVAAGEVRRYRDEVHLVRPAPILAARYPLSAPGVLRLPHGQLLVVPDEGGFRVRGAPEVRFRRGGERLLTGGRHRTLKQLLQEAGLPPWQRDALPLIHDDAGLLAVPGVAHRDAQEGSVPEPGWRAEWRPE